MVNEFHVFPCFCMKCPKKTCKMMIDRLRLWERGGFMHTTSEPRQNEIVLHPNEIKKEFSNYIPHAKSNKSVSHSYVFVGMLHIAEYEGFS